MHFTYSSVLLREKAAEPRLQASPWWAQHSLWVVSQGLQEHSRLKDQLVLPKCRARICPDYFCEGPSQKIWCVFPHHSHHVKCFSCSQQFWYSGMHLHSPSSPSAVWCCCQSMCGCLYVALRIAVLCFGYVLSLNTMVSIFTLVWQALLGFTLFIDRHWSMH